MLGPHPLFHATSTRPVGGMPDGWTARVLHLQRPDGAASILAPLVAYMKAHPHRSTTWQNTIARGLGLFWDFYRAKGSEIVRLACSEGRDPQRLLYREFAFALVNGTISADGDRSGLYWPRTPLKRARELTAAIENFADWYHEEYDGERLETDVPGIAPDEPLTLADYLAWGRVRKISMLSHLRRKPAKVTVNRAVDLGPDPCGIGAEPVKFFPPNHAEHLLWKGYKRPGAEQEANPFLQFSVRDQMLELLDGWGGLRQSEGLHLWVQDVVEEPGKTGHALVVINHPSEAVMTYTDRVTGQERRASREEILSQIYGLRPRHLVKNSAYHVGWKGMDLNRDHQAFVYWLDDTAARLFWTLYHGYLRFVRKPIMAERQRRGGYNHPFLFVCETDPRREGIDGMVGDPYSTKAHARNFRAAVARIGLPCGKWHGTSTQGMRHLYGQTLLNLGLPAQVIRKGLHHRHFLSQVPYTVPTRARINAELNAARQRRLGARPSVPPLGHDSSQALLRLHLHITTGSPDV